jgi:hypothetical protein
VYCVPRPARSQATWQGDVARCQRYRRHCKVHVLVAPGACLAPGQVAQQLACCWRLASVHAPCYSRHSACTWQFSHSALEWIHHQMAGTHRLPPFCCTAPGVGLSPNTKNTRFTHQLQLLARPVAPSWMLAQVMCSTKIKRPHHLQTRLCHQARGSPAARGCSRRYPPYQPQPSRRNTMQAPADTGLQTSHTQRSLERA